MTKARRLLMLSAVFLAFFVGAISAISRLYVDLELLSAPALCLLM
jgi:hypothetical protein